MKNYEAIHESIIKDILDIGNDIKDIKDSGWKITTGDPSKYIKSISSSTKDLILTFPLLVSSDISMETATMIMKAQERKCATMIQMLIASQNFEVATSGGVLSYISQFHNNMKPMDMYLSDYLDMMDSAVRHAGALSEDTADVVLNNNTVLYEMELELANSLASSVLADDINRQSLRRFFVENTGIGQAVLEADDDDIMTNRHPIGNGGSKTSFEAYGKMMLPAEIKKANELMPTMMAVAFNQVDGEGKFNEQRTAVIGVKCKLYPVEYSDITNHVTGKIKDSNWLINLIRATTSEISFMKDFVLAIDKAKLDAKSYSSQKGTSNKMWKVLERRAFKSKAKRLMRKPNDCTAITTLVLSKNVVDYMNKTDQVNVMRTNTARTLMESFNLMSIVIVDEGMEVAHFLYDTGEDSFESISFNGLERESNDGSYRKVVNLLSKKM